MFLKLRLELKKKRNIYIYSRSSYPNLYVHAQVIQNCTTFSRADIYNMYRKQLDVKQRKRKPEKRCLVMFSKQNKKKRKTESAFTSFLKPWMMYNTSGFYLQLFHCNILQIFSFDHIYIPAKDVSTLTPRNKKISRVAISLTMLNRRNREHNLYDWFH